jgi:anti-sigma B factor antagonist
MSGDVDLATAAAFRLLLESAAQAPATVIVDLSDVRFMDCSGLPPLLEAHARLGDRLQLHGLRPAVRQLLLLTGLHSLFAFADKPSAESAPPGAERGSGSLPEQNTAATGTRLPTLVTALPSMALS